MYQIFIKDGTSYCFSPETYNEVHQTITPCLRRVFERVRVHSRHPTYIHIDPFGIADFYYPDETFHREVITAFYDGETTTRYP